MRPSAALPSVLVAFALSMPTPSQQPAPGISRELATARKGRVSMPRYELGFTVGPGLREVRGELGLRFDLPDVGEQDDLLLDFDGSAFEEAVLNGVPITPATVGGNHLVLPGETLGPGTNTLTAKFRSTVAATGTPLNVYRDPVDQSEYFYTLVVPADAHRLFPCFDQPDLKARFALSVVVPPGWVVVGNGAEIIDPDRPKQREDGDLEFTFAETEPISTYLFAFAAGPFVFVEDGLASEIGDDPQRRMRMYLRRSKLEHAETDKLFAMHRDALRWLGDYFAQPYPFGKLDFVLLPGFPYGGMEHAGAIFYRETALVFEHEPTSGELLRRSTLIYHEVSHQWFGNLVTMHWFDDLWLKEGFATFVAYTLLETLEPEQRAWLRFHQRVKPRAYAIDGTRGTTPIYQELQNLADAKSAYGAIVYNKAPAVLRQLQAWLGASNFQAGMRRFLAENSYGNAAWQDLVRAFEEVSGKDGRLWSQRWILAPGLPRVRVERTTEDGTITRFAITQVGAQGEDASWPLDLEILLVDADGSTRSASVSTNAHQVEVESFVGQPAPAAVLLNPRDVAYGLFLLDRQSADWLLANLAAIDDLLLRAVALSALRDTLRAGEIDPRAWADCTIEALRGEEDPETHAWLLARVGTVLGRYLLPDEAAPRRTEVTETLLTQLAVGMPGRALQTFRFLARHGDAETVVGVCQRLLAGELSYPGLALGPRDRFLALAAVLAHDGPAGEELLTAELARDAGEDRGKLAYLARAARASAAAKESYFESYLQLGEPPEQWIQDSLGYFHWPGQAELTLPYLERALDRLQWVKENRKIFFMPAWIDAFVNGHSSEAALRIVEARLAQDDLSEDIRKKILQSVDELERTVRLRRR